MNTQMIRRPVAGLLAAAALVFGAGAAAAQTAPSAPTAAEVAATLGRGVNVLGYDPIWSNPARARFKADTFKLIHDGGFSTLRVNLQAMAHMNADNQLDPQWLSTLDWVVSQAKAAGLNVIIDEHDYEVCAKDLEGCRPKLLAFWSQIGARYKDEPSSVLFEILNEPNGQLTPETWNALLVQGLGVIRQTNPTRTVVIGPAFWNSMDHLADLRLPADDNHILVTVHYYLPMTFTHQGASWVASTKNLSGVNWGTPDDQAWLETNFDRIAAWSKANNRPVFLGEFGAYEGGEMAARARWDAAVARTAEAHGLPWAYWQFDSNFVVYDLDHHEWIAPIHKALIPGS